MKLDLLTSATVVDDAIRFVSDHENEKTKSSKTVGSASWVADGVNKEEEEITTTTTNQVF